MKGYTPLQPDQLCMILRWSRDRLSIRQIAALLKRSTSTVCEALKRLRALERSARAAATEPTDAYLSATDCEQRLARRQAGSALNAQRWKVNDPIFDHFLPRLQEQHSVHQAHAGLARTLRERGCGSALPSPSTLYRLANALGWHRHDRPLGMRLCKRRARHAGGADTLHGWVKHCPPVEERPAALLDRREPLYLESDSLGAPRGDRTRLVVAVCRLTRYVMLGWLPDTRASTTREWLERRIERQALPVLGVIPDQGMEFSQLPLLKNIPIYPCEAHKPWQKPTVENINGCLRHYIAKGRSMDHLDLQTVAYIEHQLNNRPRKCLGWLTPLELLSQLCPAVRL